MEWLDEILRDYPETAAAKDRLKYWQDRYNTIEKENEKLRQEVDRLRRENIDLQNQIERQLKTAGFIESEGVLWKRKPNGTYERNPYCPICKVVMTPSPPMLPTVISCIKCSFTAPFIPDNLNEIISELPK